ncbi:PDDEXK nuclease domain-containing protein [Leptolyngbya sp. GGD]|uniref:PDDEXK nuclease domain-containing protein n=1 Tax=Leptolyngbya sp. GGD TaxID=2997907 RepID=UPI00227A147C|nr:PDDEXK nuclease domain-containing protein [Leptolyngbya sp. GGD]MCY6494574.1 PDDEXK nuclease domain-containing protein [Leptolyngbya sp. GGD]
MTQQSSLFPQDYDAFLNQLKAQIRRAQVAAATALNREVILLYWQLGKEILERQEREGWGSKVVDRLAKDLQREFPDVQGFSARNLKYMRAFAEAYPDVEIVQQLLHKLPWGHLIRLLDSVKNPEERIWYAQQAIENGWSRTVLAYQIESDLHKRLGGAITNFDLTLPKPQSDLAKDLIKDPYNFSFLTLGKDAQERDLEAALVTHIRDFLLELGMGFAFMGSQYPITVDGKEYRLDLLFYHVRLRCYVVLELKMVEFEPEFSGKLNFYVSAIDDLLRHEDDQPTIGIILCKSKKKTTVEYALRNLSTPIAVSTHQLPDQLRQSLPSSEQLEMEIDTKLSEISSQTSKDEET